MNIGYWLSSEEHSPRDLVANAKRAEDAGFDHLLISDHFHPWVDEQGNSPFVWSVIGGIASATQRIGLGTAVTCPLIRIHPAIVAHAAATVAAMMPGRFFLGVGTGENLNEHVHGDKWPAPDVRLAMLDEAIDVMRELWQGDYQTHRGKHYSVEQARLYTLPDEPPPIVVAAAQPKAAKLAGEKGEGYMNTTPDREIVKTFEEAGGIGARYGKVTVVFVDSMDEAKRIAKERWPNQALGGSLSQDLALPRDFEAASQTVREEDLEESIVLGTDLEAIKDKIKEFEDAGFTHVALHDITERQQEFIEFAKRLL
jgi:coenzyme F420-dependent glucose-6-phosphate dehydrogenase